MKSYNIFIKENIDVKKYLMNCEILFNNLEEVKHICQILTDLGFIVFNADEIMESDEFGFRGFVPSKDRYKKFDFQRTMNAKTEGLEIISYEKFLEITHSQKPKVRWYYKGKLEKINNDFINETLSKEEIKDILKNCSISYDSLREMVNICKKLMELGFNIYNYKEILDDNLDFEDRFICKCYAPPRKNNKKWDFVRTTGIREDTDHLTYPEFIKLITGKEIERTFSPEDPYGEEDWGIFENKFREYEVGDEVIHVKYGNCKIKQIANMNSWLCYVHFNDGKKVWCWSNKLIPLNEPISHDASITNIYDPYSEEDWNYMTESFETNDVTEFIKSSQIFYSDLEEMKNICQELTNMGLKVYNSDVIMNAFKIDYISFVPDEDVYGEFGFVRSRNKHATEAEHHIDYEKFIDLIHHNKPKIRWYYKGKLDK